MATTFDQPYSNAPGGDFPKYSDGDVLVVLSPSRQYQFHSRNLRLHSDFFKRVLTEDNAAQLTSKARRAGVKIVYRVELELPPGGDQGTGRLQLRHLDNAGRAQGHYQPPDIENGKLPPIIYRHYDNLFRAYYYQPVLLDDTTISYVLRDVVGLIDVAEYVGSMKVVSLCVDNALIKQGHVLFRSISANACVWADLAFRVRSELIFKESIVHMVGQWHHLHTRTDIRAELRALCQRKHDALDQVKRAIELRIMGHYPTHIQRPVNSNTGPGSVTTRGRGQSTRATSYASDIFAWMAMNLFRHWLGQHMCGDLNRHAPDGGHAFYHALHKAGDAYIDRAAVESFTQYFPLSAKARSALEEQMGMLKEGVKPYVARLVENRSMLDVGRWPVGYLTCVEVEKGDVPWVEKRAAGGSSDVSEMDRGVVKQRKRKRDDGVESERDEEEDDNEVGDEGETHEEPKDGREEMDEEVLDGTHGDERNGNDDAYDGDSETGSVED